MNADTERAPPRNATGRVAIVTGWFPTASETFVIGHAAGLMDLGLEVDLFAFKRCDEVIHPQLEAYGLCRRVTYLPTDLQADPAAIRPFIDRRYQAIHCHFGMIAERVAFLKQRLPDTKLFVTFHGLDVLQGLECGGEIYRSTFTHADGVIAICRFNRDRLAEIGCPAEKLLDLPNGVDIDSFHFTERPMGRVLRIVTTARLHPDKNIAYALRVMKALMENGVEFSYTIIGDGPQRPGIEECIIAWGLADRVRLLGMCAQGQVIAQLAQADLFFLPSRNEAFPVSLLEAQAMGLPVISTEVGGTAEALIHGRTGLLLRSDDVQQARDAITGFTGDAGRARLAGMGRHARRFVAARFDARMIYRRCAQWYGCR